MNLSLKGLPLRHISYHQVSMETMFVNSAFRLARARYCRKYKARVSRLTPKDIYLIRGLMSLYIDDMMRRFEIEQLEL